MGADTSSLKGTANNPKLQWLSNLSPGYIMKLKERFEYACDDFTLDEASLKQFFKCSDRECKILFEHFDMDGNGKVDSYEFVCAMAMMSHATLEEKAELIFNLYDFDGNKYISRDELVILMTNVLAAMKAMQQLPAPNIQEIEAKTDDFFRKADADADKKITLKEFKEYVTKDKEILEILLSANVAKREDLGTDFGSGTSAAPDVDPDLELELNPKELQKSQKKQNMKDGNDLAVQSEDGLVEMEDVGEGDQFMAVKPWKGVVDNSVPSKYKPNKRDGEAPDATLQLEYIHGYRCHDARNNLRYTATGQIVYHAAAVGIVLDQVNNTQRFFKEHNDDIHCLAIDPTGKFCATGQIGPKPLLCVWNNETMECVARIQGTLLKGIKTIAFSPDGKMLAASAFDDDHSIAIYNWSAKLKPGETIKPIASGKGTRANILSLGFNPQGIQLVATAVKEVVFFTFDGGLVKGKKGTGWTNNQQAVLCQAFLNDTLYTGLFDGSILQWAGTGIKGATKAHTEGCHSLVQRPRQPGLISGGGDGLVIIWQAGAAGLSAVKQYDLKAPAVKSVMPKVRSVCENPTTGALLVGTRGGEIVEFSAQEGAKPLTFMKSHFEGELWGLATHPTKEEYITVGQDNILAIWDIRTRKQKRFGKLEQAANVAAYSHDGLMLAIGYTNGSLHVLLLEQKFALKANKKDRTHAIQEIKFSPDDSLCCVGAHDSMIFVYDVKQNFKLLKKMKGHPSTITHIDFALDGRTIMSNCTSYNILFFDLMSGKHMPSGASAKRDETWETWTCTLGWPVQGIFPPCSDGTDINACDRAPDGTVLATADDFGMVKLFRYPCPVERAAFHQQVGHSSHVTNVRFVKNSNYLISTGGEDKCIFQWKYFIDKESQKQSLQAKAAPVNIANIEDDLGVDEAPSQSELKGKAPNLNDQYQFEMEDVGEGDQRMAVLPFLGQVKNSVPSNFKGAPGDVPEGNLKLKYAHGFRSFDTRNNLKYLSSNNDIAFTTAALGVVMNKPANTQRFFNLHEEDVVSLAIHPSRDILATGQMAAKGKAKLIDIFVWRVSTMEVLAHLNNFHRGAIRKLEFSPNGDKLLTIGEDKDNSVAIYDWANKKMLCKSAVDPDKVFDACWKDELEFATVGMKHVKFFTMDGINIQSAKGIYGAAGVTPTISCHYAFGEKIFLTGTPTGDLLMWNGRNIGKAHKQHTDALWSIKTVQNGSMLLTGGNDGKVVFWDKTFAPKKVIDLTPMSQFPAGVRALDYHEQAKTILVGTRSAEIIEVSQTGQKLKTVIQGHFEGTKQAELWGCAVHPSENIFASCGADRTIRLWNENQMIKASEQYPNDLTAIDWASNGQFLVVGDRNGIIYLVDSQTLQTLGNPVPGSLSGKKNAWVEDLKISPDSSMVAFGTHGGLSKIEMVKVINGGKALQKQQPVDIKISSAVTHLDWSADSRKVVVNSQAYELMWLDVQSRQVLTASSAKDIEWATWTSVLGFPVQGIWPPESDFTDVNSVCRSNSRRVLASADDFGKVKLFKYPCVVERAQYSQYMGHSSHVTKVKFSHDDRFVVTTGGNDKTVIIWETDFGFGQEGGAQQQEFGEEEEEVKGDQQFEICDDDLEDLRCSMVDQARIQKENMKLELKSQKTQLQKKSLVQDANPFIEEEDIGHGDEFMAVQPWKEQIRPPTGWKKPPKGQNLAPMIQLELDWVHGYRTRDSRNNIGILQDQSIAYHAAALGIAYDPTTHKQRFFNNHSDDITAIAFSSDKRLVATGEIGPKPVINVWDAITMQLKMSIRSKLTKGIQALSFSPSGKVLAAVAVDVDHSVAAFSINSENGTQACLGIEKGDKSQILDISMKDDVTFATSGIKHFKQWGVGANLTAKAGSFGKYDQRHGVCKYAGEVCLSGSITGEMYVWSGNSLTQAVKLHDKPIDAIHVTMNHVFTGGKDMKVCVLQSGSFTQLFNFTINEMQWGSVCGKVRAMCLNDAQNTLYVGTLGSEIFQVPINMGKKTIGEPKKLISGHYAPSMKDNNEIWGLAVYPSGDHFATVSDDATLRIWNSKDCKQVKCISLLVDENGIELPLDPATSEPCNATKGRSIAISPDSKWCVLGSRDGNLRIYQIQAGNDLKLVKRMQISATNKWIQDIKFSPDGKYLGVACHDQKVYIFTVGGGQFAKKSVCAKSTSAVTHFDWSKTQQYIIHTNDLSYEILYYNAENGQQNLQGDTGLKDEPWATWTLPMGWPSQGIWPPGVDGSDINAVDRSNTTHPDGYQLIASADDTSRVNVFRYPCSEENSKPIVGKGHSSHVTMVKFSSDDQYLFSAGGNDQCIFQWKITKG